MVESAIHIESPLLNTLVRLPDSTTFDRVEIPIEFTANAPSIQTWSIRISHGTVYRVWTMAIVDSVYVSDSQRMFPVTSQTTRKAYGIVDGGTWVIYAASDEHYIQQ